MKFYRTNSRPRRSICCTCKKLQYLLYWNFQNNFHQKGLCTSNQRNQCRQLWDWKMRWPKIIVVYGKNYGRADRHSFVTNFGQFQFQIRTVIPQNYQQDEHPNSGFIDFTHRGLAIQNTYNASRGIFTTPRLDPDCIRNRIQSKCSIISNYIKSHSK